MRLGLIGGTFDPIHNAHLLIAEEARVQHSLDRVLFIPNNVPAHKDLDAVSEAHHRYEMARLATEPNPAFRCSRVELDRPGKSYTVDTLRALHAEHPGAELFFIIGMDTVGEVATWKDHEEVLRLVNFLAAERPGYSLEGLLPLLPEHFADRVLSVKSTPLAIAATDIRARVRAGRPIRYLTPDAVVEYVTQQGLYLSE